MASSIERAEAEVQRGSGHITAIAEREGLTLTAAEAELWAALLALGRALLVLFLARASARSRPTTYEHEGVRYALDTTIRRHSEIGTRFGKVKFSRPLGRRLGGRGRTDLPVDRELGLCAGFSLGTVTAMAQLCAMLAFGNARRLFAEFHEWAPSPRATLRMVDAVGAEARGFLDVAAVPDDDGEVLVIQVDGRGAPSATIWRRGPSSSLLSQLPLAHMTRNLSSYARLRDSDPGSAPFLSPAFAGLREDLPNYCLTTTSSLWNQ